MTPKQRILAALDCRQPDRVPVFELYINEPNIVSIAQLLAPDADRVKATKDRFGQERDEILDLYCLVVETLGLDATSTNFSIGIEPIGEDMARDKYGTVYRLSEHGEPLPVDGPIKELADLKGFDMASKLRPDDFAVPRYVIEKAGTERAHFVCITDPFKIAWRRRGGMQHLLMDYVINPELVHGLGRVAVEFDLAAIDMAAAAGADAIIVPGDLAGEHSMIISPAHYREYLLPCHQQMVERAHSRGLKIVKHSDGDIWPILDDILSAGFDGVHPIQPQSMDIGEVKRHLAGKACVLGNIDCRGLLVSGSVDEVVETVKATIDAAAPGGGYIMSSSNSIHPGCKSENYVAMVRAAHEYGAY